MGSLRKNITSYTLFFIRTSTFAVKAETKVDFLIFLCFEPEMFLNYVLKLRGIEFPNFTVVVFFFLGEFTLLLFHS